MKYHLHINLTSQEVLLQKNALKNDSNEANAFIWHKAISGI